MDVMPYSNSRIAAVHPVLFSVRKSICSSQNTPPQGIVIYFPPPGGEESTDGPQDKPDGVSLHRSRHIAKGPRPYWAVGDKVAEKPDRHYTAIADSRSF